MYHLSCINFIYNLTQSGNLRDSSLDLKVGISKLSTDSVIDRIDCSFLELTVHKVTVVLNVGIVFLDNIFLYIPWK